MHIRAKELIIYKRKNLREYQKYVAIYNIYFIMVDEDKLNRIKLAVIYLRGNAFSI